MTQIVDPPAGPFPGHLPGPLTGDVELDLVPLGVPFSKAAYHFADDWRRAEVIRRVEDIRKLDPNFGLLDRDGSPLLTPEKARELARDYDNKEFAYALQMYANSFEMCQIDLVPKIGDGCLAVCREREPGSAWGWVTAKAYVRSQMDDDLKSGGLVYDVAEVRAWLAQRATEGNNRPTDNEVIQWFLAFYQSAATEGRPPPKQKEEAFPTCRAKIGATEDQMRRAIKEVPADLKKGVGRPPKASAQK